MYFYRRIYSIFFIYIKLKISKNGYQMLGRFINVREMYKDK